VAQTADELVAKNIAAKASMEKLKSVKSMRATADDGGPAWSSRSSWSTKRPQQHAPRVHGDGMTGMQVYDGKTAWMSIAVRRQEEPEVMPADQAKMVEEQADFDGPLVDYNGEGQHRRAGR